MKKKYKISNCVLVHTNKVQQNDLSQKPCDFETAIEATGFGKYNLILAFTLLFSSFVATFDTTSLSYVVPIAHCDLNLSLEDKGLLNAITYLGMIASAFIWGFISDIFGRKRFLVVGFLLDAVIVLIGGISQHYIMLVASKFMAGFIISGPLAIHMSYLNEFHSSKYRAYIPLLVGVAYSIGCIILPMLGWLIFSDKFFIELFNGTGVLRSWNIFLLLCSLPSLLVGLTFIALPESPKFLMSIGEYEKALKSFQKAYSVNTGKPPEAYPIKHLIEENRVQKNSTQQHYQRNKLSGMEILRDGWKQFVPLLQPPYIKNLVTVLVIEFGVMMGVNTLRLWLPQLFTAINDYQSLHGKTEDLCKMMEMVHSPSTTNVNCFVNYDNQSVYINNIIVATIVMLNYLVVVAIVKKAGKRNVLVVTAFCSGICGVCLYFAKTEAVVIGLSSMYAGLSSVSVNVLITIVVDIFPTAFRTMSISLTMMLGRVGTVIGNLIFPQLLTAGCLPPFLMISCLVVGAALLSMLLPKTDNKALE